MVGGYKGRDIQGSGTNTNNVTTGETTLGTTILQAQGLSGLAGNVHVLAWGTVANNANAKTLKFYVGATSQAFTLPASAAASWFLDAWIFANGSANQEAVASVTAGTAALPATAETYTMTPTEFDLANITVKVTGTATATNDIVCNACYFLV